jgi:hypothetical protein
MPFEIIQPPHERGLTAHMKRVRAMRCVVSDDPSVTLHHAKGGSMVKLLGDAGNPGVGKKVSDWLVIPLNWRYHTGDYGIDNGLAFKGKEHWELAYGTQVSHLIAVSIELGYNVFARAGFGHIRIAELEHLAVPA